MSERSFNGRNDGGIKGLCQGIISTCTHRAHGLAHTKLGEFAPTKTFKGHVKDDKKGRR